MNDRLYANLSALESAAAAVIETPVPEEDTPDLAGRLLFVESNLARHRRSQVDEVEGEIEGSEYVLVQDNRAARTYNDQRILLDYAKARDTSIEGALLDLIAAGALKLQWGWLKLEQALLGAGVTISKQSEPIATGDLDTPHVGVLWQKKPRVKGKEKE